MNMATLPHLERPNNSLTLQQKVAAAHRVNQEQFSGYRLAKDLAIDPSNVYKYARKNRKQEMIYESYGRPSLLDAEAKMQLKIFILAHPEATYRVIGDRIRVLHVETWRRRCLLNNINILDTDVPKKMKYDTVLKYIQRFTREIANEENYFVAFGI